MRRPYTLVRKFSHAHQDLGPDCVFFVLLSRRTANFLTWQMAQPLHSRAKFWAFTQITNFFVWSTKHLRKKTISHTASVISHWKRKLSHQKTVHGNYGKSPTRTSQSVVATTVGWTDNTGAVTNHGRLQVVRGSDDTSNKRSSHLEGPSRYW